MTVSIRPVSGWRDVLAPMLAALAGFGYPGNVQGQGNAACLVVECVEGKGVTVDGSQGWPQLAAQEVESKRLRGNWWGVSARNWGYNGLHSEPAILQRVNSRYVVGGSQAYLFTERSPCGNCWTSINQYAKTWGCDIEVMFFVPWTDFGAVAANDERYDAIEPAVRSMLGWTSNEIRDAVVGYRKRFPEDG